MRNLPISVWIAGALGILLSASGFADENTYAWKGINASFLVTEFSPPRGLTQKSIKDDYAGFLKLLDPGATPSETSSFFPRLDAALDQLSKRAPSDFVGRYNYIRTVLTGWAEITKDRWTARDRKLSEKSLAETGVLFRVRVPNPGSPFHFYFFIVMRKIDGALAYYTESSFVTATLVSDADFESGGRLSNLNWIGGFMGAPARACDPRVLREAAADVNRRLRP